uniref:Uncharacterized protein n=1 Tax=Anguilla anguilla TaxID=7936 RepID=A0A0E9U3T1_ANGAN
MIERISNVCRISITVQIYFHSDRFNVQWPQKGCEQEVRPAPCRHHTAKMLASC